MTAEEIFAKIDAHMIEGIMFHDQMAAYFDFLNLRGYKREHECRAFDEFLSHRKIVRYYINHYNKLLPETHAGNPSVIPSGWIAYERSAVDESTKKRAIRDAFRRWREWESETKRLYEDSYSALCEIGEIAATCKVKTLVEDVDGELKMVDRQCITLADINYDLPTIIIKQDDMHEEYREREEKMGVKID